MPLPIVVGVVFGLLALWIAGSNPACGVGLLVVTVMIIAALSAGTSALRQAAVDDLRTKKGQIVIWKSSPYVLVDVSDNGATLRPATITAVERGQTVSAPTGEVDASSMPVAKTSAARQANGRTPDAPSPRIPKGRNAP